MLARTITFTVAPDGLTPQVVQQAGVAGDHNCTKIVFNFSKYLPVISSSTSYRIEFVDGGDNFDSTMLKSLNPATTNVSVLLPASWTTPGGVAQIRLVIVEVDSNNQPQCTIYSHCGYLKFDMRNVGSTSHKINTKNSLDNLLCDVESKLESARQATQKAWEAANGVDNSIAQANSATELAVKSANHADSAAKKADDSALNAGAATQAANSVIETTRDIIDTAKGQIFVTNQSLEKLERSFARIQEVTQDTINYTENTQQATKDAKAAIVDMNNQINEAVKTLDNAVSRANSAIENTNTAATNANTVADSARQTADHSMQALDTLKTVISQVSNNYINCSNALINTKSGKKVDIDDISPICYFNSLCVHGNSTQNGTPHYTKPVPINGLTPSLITVSKNDLSNNINIDKQVQLHGVGEFYDSYDVVRGEINNQFAILPMFNASPALPQLEFLSQDDSTHLCVAKNFLPDMQKASSKNIVGLFSGGVYSKNILTSSEIGVFIDGRNLYIRYPSLASNPIASYIEFVSSITKDNPLQIVYLKENHDNISVAPQLIKGYENYCSVQADNAEFSVTYNQDINVLIKQILSKLKQQ